MELLKRGLEAKRETPIKVFYEGKIVGEFVADIIIESKVIIELKSVKEIHPAHACPVKYTAV